MKAYLEDYQTLMSVSTLFSEWKSVSGKTVKARNPESYYENFYIEYYYFYRQCKDHFKTADIDGREQVFFATSFLKNQILFW